MLFERSSSLGGTVHGVSFLYFFYDFYLLSLTMKTSINLQATQTNTGAYPCVGHTKS